MAQSARKGPTPSLRTIIPELIAGFHRNLVLVLDKNCRLQWACLPSLNTVCWLSKAGIVYSNSDRDMDVRWFAKGWFLLLRIISDTFTTI